MSTKMTSLKSAFYKTFQRTCLVKVEIMAAEGKHTARMKMVKDKVANVCNVRSNRLNTRGMVLTHCSCNISYTRMKFYLSKKKKKKKKTPRCSPPLKKKKKKKKKS